jgi:hypothetical protein
MGCNEDEMIKNSSGKLSNKLMATDIPMDDMIEDMIVDRSI